MSVRTDVINLSVNVNGNKAQAELNDLRKRAADVKFEMEGLKKGTQEYVEKKAQLSEITSSMTRLKQEIGITALTQRELTSELSKLKALRSNVDPLGQDFKNLTTQINAADARLKQIKSTTEGFGHVSHETGISFSEIFTRTLEYTGAYELISKLASGVRDFFKSSIEQADKAEESAAFLKNALENAGRVDLFDTLTAQAEKFAEAYKRINVNDIKNVFTKLVDYGKLTQDQITSLTDVIINYAAKQRISITEATDVFTKALEGNTRGLKTYGVDLSNAHTVTERFGLIVGQMGEKVKGAEAAFEQTSKGIKEVFLESIVQAKEKIGDWINSLLSAKKSADSLFDSAKEKVEGYNNSLDPLLARYDQLKSKTNLNKTEQSELKSVIQQIAAIVPTAVTAMDSYGNAMDINRQKVIDFKRVNQDFLQAKEKDAIDEFIHKAQVERDLIQGNIEDFKKGNEGTKVVTNARGDEIGHTKATNEELQELQKEIAKSRDKFLDFTNTLQQKYGVELPKDLAAFREATIEATTTPPKAGSIEKLNFDIEKAKKNIADLKEKILQIDTTSADFAVNKVALAETQKALDGLITKRDKLQSGIIGNGDPNVDHSADKEAAAEAKRAREEHARLVKEADDFYKQLEVLRKKAATKDETPEQAEIDQVKIKYEQLLAKAKDYYARKIIDKKKEGEEETLLEKAQADEINAIFAKFYKQEFEKQVKEEYQTALNYSQDYYDEQKQKLAQSFSDGKLTQEQYNAEIKKLDLQSAQDRLIVAENYSANSKEAAADVAKTKKELEKQVTQNLVDETNKRLEETKKAQKTANEEALAKADRNVIQSQGKGIDVETEAKKAQLQKKFEIETKGQEKTSEMYLDKQAQLNQALDQLDAEATQKKISNVEKYLGYFQSALTSLNQFINNRENRLLSDEEKRNNKQKKELKAQLDAKLISQAQYDKKVADLDEKLDQDKKEISNKQAKRQKALSIFSAILSTAEAIAAALTAKPFGPWNIVEAGIVGVLGGLQVAAIAKEPLPEAGTGDWFRTGDKHSDPSGGIPVLIERDEAVVKAAAMTDNKVLSVTGTTAQITSALNARKGGVNWAGGAVVEMPKWRTEAPASINPGLPRIMEQGGIARPVVNTGTTSTSGNVEDLLKTLIQKQDDSTQEMKNWKTKIKGDWVIKDLDETRSFYNAAKKVSGLNQ